MSEGEIQLTCTEFQSRLCELLASDEPIEELPHYKTCLLCRHLVHSFEEMIEKTLGGHFGTNGGPGTPRIDDWPEFT